MRRHLWPALAFVCAFAALSSAHTAVATVAAPAAAAAVSASDTLWSPGQLYVFAQPYLVAVFNVLFLALLAWLGTLLRKHLGVTVDRDVQEKIAAAASSAAGRIMASQDAGFAAMKIDVGHPLIAKEVPIVIKMLGKVAPPPDQVAHMVQGAIGQLQAQASSIPPAQGAHA